MKNFTLNLLAASVLALGATAANAVNIDLFNGAQVVQIPPGTGVSASELSGLPVNEVIGGARDMWIGNKSGGGTSSAVVDDQGFNSQLAVQNPPGANSDTIITWDGNETPDAPLAVDVAGLGSVNFTSGGALGIFLNVIFIDTNVNLTLIAWSGGGSGSGEITKNCATATACQPLFIRFDDLNWHAIGGGGNDTINWTAISALQLKLTGPAGFDAIIDFIETRDRPPEMPEPATLALMGLGLAGLGAMRRRQS